MYKSGGIIVTKLSEDERLDYLLNDSSMKIVQSPTIFSYSLDAVLLAAFTYVPIRKGSILDLCTGNGIIPLLLSKRTNGNIIGVEIQKRLADMAERSVQLNHLTEQITIINDDLKKIKPTVGQSVFDVVTCNPPYFSTPAKTEYNKNDYLTIARHEVCCTLEDVVKACKLHVKPGGKVSLVHRPERLVDIITLLRKYNIEPKRLQLVYPKRKREANTLLIEGVRDGNPGLKMLSPLYIYNEDDTYTKQAYDIIYGK